MCSRKLWAFSMRDRRSTSPVEESRRYPNKISTLDAELVLRDVPGKSRQRRRQSRRIRPFFRGRPLEQPPRREVLRVALAPRSLRSRASPSLTFPRRTRLLPTAHSRVWLEPLPTKSTRTLSRSQSQCCTLAPRTPAPIRGSGKVLLPAEDAFTLELRASSPDGPQRSGGGAKHLDEILGGSCRFLLRGGSLLESGTGSILASAEVPGYHRPG
jgi:hypothetical protein